MEQEHSEFLQSWDWGEFQRAVGREPVRLQIIEDGRSVSRAQGLVHRLPFGLRYLYAPRCRTSDPVLHLLINEIGKSDYCFVRLEPILPITMSELRSPKHEVPNRQPQYTLFIDLSQSEDELLAAMHPKTRYNIKLAERNGVEIKVISDIRDKRHAIGDIFWPLMRETAKRDKFRPHSKRYYDRMLEMPIARLLIAYNDNTPIAANILVAYGDTCTYLHGASGDRGRNLMATYLLQWRGMQSGKSLGCRWYDLWGVAPQVHSSQSKAQSFHNYCWQAGHPWSGITRFKAGFGGEPRSYPRAIDMIFHPLQYRLYTILQRCRRIL